MHPEDLPSVLADDKLKWAITMLKDPTFQSLLRKYLAGRLRAILLSLQSPVLPRASFASPASAVSAANIALPHLPFEDKLCRHAVQLCQLAFENNDGGLQQIYPVRNKILRELIPQVMAAVLSHDGHSTNEGPDSSGMDYRTPQMKSQDAKRGIFAVIDAAITEGSSSILDQSNAQRFKLFFESISKQLAEVKFAPKK